MRLSLFDLDPTLLDGDSDPLWCDGPIARGLLPRQPFAAANPRRMRDDARDRLWICDVTGSEERTVSRFRFDGIGGLRELLSGAGKEHHLRALPRQLHRNTPADPSA